MKQLVLASQSPRRKMLLQRLQIPFVIDASNIPEPMDMTKDPRTLVKELSEIKAREVAKRYTNAVILAADTFVVVDGRYLGKPQNRKDAEEMLAFQSGKMQEVVTGFTLLDTDSQNIYTEADSAKVYIKVLSKDAILRYLDKNTYKDKAGAYAIQDVGKQFIEKIEGNYDTIVGLPVKAVQEKLKEFLD